MPDAQRWVVDRNSALHLLNHDLAVREHQNAPYIQNILLADGEFKSKNDRRILRLVASHRARLFALPGDQMPLAVSDRQPQPRLTRLWRGVGIHEDGGSPSFAFCRSLPGVHSTAIP